jgi:hypothetical protein
MWPFSKAQPGPIQTVLGPAVLDDGFVTFTTAIDGREFTIGWLKKYAPPDDRLRDCRDHLETYVRASTAYAREHGAEQLKEFSRFTASGIFLPDEMYFGHDDADFVVGYVFPDWPDGMLNVAFKQFAPYEVWIDD